MTRTGRSVRILCAVSEQKLRPPDPGKDPFTYDLAPAKLMLFLTDEQN